jgi:hypothetical protein
MIAPRRPRGTRQAPAGRAPHHAGDVAAPAGRCPKVIVVMPPSADFVSDLQILAQAARFGFRIGDAPVPARCFPEASSIGFRRSVVYGLGTRGVLLRYLGHRLGIVRCRLFSPRSALAPG